MDYLMDQQIHSDGVTDGLPDGSTDDSVDVWMEGKFHGKCSLGKFCPGILVGIFTMKLSDCWTDRMVNRHTDGQMDFQVEPHFG